MGLNTDMIEVCTESWKTHHSQNGVEADTSGKAGDGPSTGDKHRVIDYQLAHHDWGGFDEAGGKGAKLATIERFISRTLH